MSAILTSTGVTYGDSTAQATAFLGSRGSVYTSAGSYTFTIPTGITALKVTVVGGGGGTAGATCTTFPGGSGGTSSVSSGTQTISTISATGGAGSSGVGNAIFSAGVGSGGDINSYGADGIRVVSGLSQLSGSSLSYGRRSAAGTLGAGANGTAYADSGGGGGTAIKWLTGLTPGATLSVTVGAGGSAGANGGNTGGVGAVIFEW